MLNVNRISIFLVALIIVPLYFINRFRWDPIFQKNFYKSKPSLLSKWYYAGGVNKMRKLRIASRNSTEPLSFRIGFELKNEGYLFFGNVDADSGSAVVETYLGKEGCEFVFATDHPRDLRITLLDESDQSKPDAVFPPHWWQTRK